MSLTRKIVSSAPATATARGELSPVSDVTSQTKANCYYYYEKLSTLLGIADSIVPASSHKA